MSVGKLYRFSDNQFVANVNYRLMQQEAGINWWGELTLIDWVRVDDGERFIIELEDARKSKCLLKKRVNAPAGGVPPRYVYHVSGTGPLK